MYRACCFESTLADRWGAIFEAVARTQCITDKAGDTSFRFTNSLGPTNCDQWSSSTTTDRSGTQDLSYALFDTFHHPKSDQPPQRANHQLNPQAKHRTNTGIQKDRNVTQLKTFPRSDTHSEGTS